MISPNVKWDHSETWFVTHYAAHAGSTTERKVEISLSDPEFEFVIGHYIDGMCSLTFKHRAS